MAKDKYQIVICRTCVRDNPESGIFGDFETNARFYQENLKEGVFKKTADLRYQNCFAQCENFHCVQVSRNGEGFLLKKISSREKANELLDWVKQSKAKGELKLPSHFKDHLVQEIKVTEKYAKP